MNEIHRVVLRMLDDLHAFQERIEIEEPRNIERAIKNNDAFFKLFKETTMALTHIGTAVELENLTETRIDEIAKGLENAIESILGSKTVREDNSTT